MLLDYLTCIRCKNCILIFYYCFFLCYIISVKKKIHNMSDCKTYALGVKYFYRSVCFHTQKTPINYY